MLAHLLRAALIPLIAFTQAPTRAVVVGTVNRISKNEIIVEAGTESVRFRSDQTTRLWKGKSPGDLTALRAGDEVSVHGVRDPNGALTASDVWARITTHQAVVAKLDIANSAIQARPKAGPGSARVDAPMVIHYYPNTAFSSSRIRLQVGQEILVVGFDLPDGSIDALRIATYNTDLPVRRYSAVPAPHR